MLFPLPAASSYDPRVFIAVLIVAALAAFYTVARAWRARSSEKGASKNCADRFALIRSVAVLALAAVLLFVNAEAACGLLLAVAFLEALMQTHDNVVFSMTGLVILSSFVIGTYLTENGMFAPPEAAPLQGMVITWLIAIAGVSVVSAIVCRELERRSLLQNQRELVSQTFMVIAAYAVSFSLLGSRGWRFATIVAIGAFANVAPRKWKLATLVVAAILATVLADHADFYTLIPLSNGGLYRVQTVFALGLLGFTATASAVPWIFSLFLWLNLQGVTPARAIAVGLIVGALSAFASSKGAKKATLASLMTLTMAIALLSSTALLTYLIAFAIIGLFFDNTYIKFVTVVGFGAAIAATQTIEKDKVAMGLIAISAAMAVIAAIQRKRHSPDGLSDVKSTH